MQDITKQLEQLGLGGYEAVVYKALLTASPAGASVIAKQCNLSRSSVYTTLAALIVKGLVGTTYKNDIKQFIAQDYATLEHMLEREERQLEVKKGVLKNLRESFQRVRQTNLNIPQMIFFEGQEGLKRIYSSMMRQAPPHSVLYLCRDEFVWQPEWRFIFEADWHDRVKRMKMEKRITTKLLVNDSAEERRHNAYYHSRKHLAIRFLRPPHTLKQFAVYIIGDIVSILSMENSNLVGMKVTNRHFATNFISIFESLWTTSRDQRRPRS